ncbi:MAG: hypothetical protein ABW044_07385, partial [Cellvibrio sp.]
INISTDLMPLNINQAASLKAEKPRAGFYSNLSDFDVSWSKISGATGATVDKELTINTKYFWLTTFVQIGDQRRVGRSLLLRGNPEFKVVRREEGGIETN